MSLGSIEELIVFGVGNGYIVRESNQISYPREGKSYSADPEERVRAAVYVWLRQRHPNSTIRIEENQHDLRCTDLGLDMLIECKAVYQDSQDQLRSYLADVGLDQGYFACESADGQLVLEKVDRIYPCQPHLPQPHRPVVVSLINLKGGVGKTTLLIAIAEILASELGKRCLVVDLDPQTNATILLIHQNAWKRKDDAGETLYQLFASRLHPEHTVSFDIQKAVVHKVSNVAGGITNLDLLPSSIRLIDIQDEVRNIGGGVVSPAGALNAAISPVLNQYDVVMIDCPPSLGLVTINGFWISDFCLVPVVPDYLSTWGLPQIIRGVKRFNEQTVRATPLRLLGVVINMRRRVNLHQTVSDRLRAGDFTDGVADLVFQTEIPLTVGAAGNIPMGQDPDRDVPEDEFPSLFGSLNSKYRHGGLFHTYRAIADELIHRCNTMLGRDVL